MSTEIALSDSDLRRFWSKVSLPDSSGCMLWLGGRNNHGYGRLRTTTTHVGAHRVALVLSEGEPPADRPVAAHSCRNRHCVASGHLRWASPAENSGDRDLDGTTARGERDGNAKLTEDHVRAIRGAYATGRMTQRELAERYGVTRPLIGYIVRGKIWRHLQAEAAS